jgi:acetyl esterase
MPLDPDFAALLPAFAAMADPPLSAMTPAAARKRREETAEASAGTTPPQPVGSVTDVVLPGPGGDLGARIYRPGGGAASSDTSTTDSAPAATGPTTSAGAKPNHATPTVVYFHGGGFVIGNLDTHDGPARELVCGTGAVVVSVDYRLAPEAPFPAAVADCLAATRWARDHIDQLGGDPDRLAIAGDSSGGNLAAVVAQLCRDQGGPALAAQLLFYPVTDFFGDHPSHVENADAPILTMDNMDWFMGHYLGDGSGADGSGASAGRTRSNTDSGGSQLADGTAAAGDLRFDPRVSPLRNANLRQLPPAVVITAEFDPLRDEGEAYATALQEAGVPVIARRADGMIHAFFSMTALSAGAAAATQAALADFAELMER